MHAPNQISLAAKASGEPEFREIGLGPWSETHPGEPRPDDPTSSNYDGRFDSVLLNDGDRRNVLDRYRYWTVAAIKADLDARGRHDFEVAVENWTHDFNIGSMVRTANAFQAKRVHIVGPHKWNRKGALMTELYQHVEHHPPSPNWWKAGIIASPVKSPMNEPRPVPPPSMRMMWLWMETTSTFMSCWPKSMLVMHASRSFKPPASSPSTLFPAQCRWKPMPSPSGACCSSVQKAPD